MSDIGKRMSWQKWEASIPEESSPQINITDEEAKELNRMLDSVFQQPQSEDKVGE